MKTATHKFKDGSVLLLEKINTMTFPKGVKLLVTDPCYWFGQDEKTGKNPVWQQFCDMMFPDNYNTLPENEKLYTYGKATFTTAKGRKIEFLYTRTAHGDGSYEAIADGRSVKKISGDVFGVDAGMYAVVLLDDAKHLAPKEFKGDEFGCGVVFETAYSNALISVDGEDMEGAITCRTGQDEEEEGCPNCGMTSGYDGYGDDCDHCREEDEKDEDEDEDE